MHLVAILSILLFALIPSHALPDGSSDDWDGQDGHFPRHGCLKDYAAAKIVSTFEQFFVHIDPVIVDKFLTPDFEYFSDSTNSLNQSADQTVCFAEFPFSPRVQQVPYLAWKQSFTTFLMSPLAELHSSSLAPSRPPPEPYSSTNKSLSKCTPSQTSPRWLYTIPAILSPFAGI